MPLCLDTEPGGSQSTMILACETALYVILIPVGRIIGALLPREPMVFVGHYPSYGYELVIQVLRLAMRVRWNSVMLPNSFKNGLYF